MPLDNDAETFVDFLDENFKKGQVFRGFGATKSKSIWKFPTHGDFDEIVDTIYENTIWVVLEDSKSVAKIYNCPTIHVLGPINDGWISFVGYQGWIESFKKHPVERLDC